MLNSAHYLQLFLAVTSSQILELLPAPPPIIFSPFLSPFSSSKPTDTSSTISSQTSATVLDAHPLEGLSK